MNYSRKVKLRAWQGDEIQERTVTSEEFRRDCIVHSFLFSRPVRVFFIALDNDPELW